MKIATLLALLLALGTTVPVQSLATSPNGDGSSTTDGSGAAAPIRRVVKRAADPATEGCFT